MKTFHISTKRHLPRRSFLRGAGTLLAMPWLEAMVPGERVHIRVAVHADLEETAAFRYAGVTADPGAGDREVQHAGLAEVHLNVRRPGRPSLELATAAGGAYELGSREFTNAVALQPYPDP